MAFQLELHGIFAGADEARELDAFERAVEATEDVQRRERRQRGGVLEPRRLERSVDHPSFESRFERESAHRDRGRLQLEIDAIECDVRAKRRLRSDHERAPYEGRAGHANGKGGREELRTTPNPERRFVEGPGELRLPLGCEPRMRRLPAQTSRERAGGIRIESPFDRELNRPARRRQEECGIFERERA